MSLLDNPIIRLVAGIVVSGAFFVALFAILPEHTAFPIPDDLISAIEWMITGMYSFDFIIPITTLFQIFFLIMTMKIVLIGFKLFFFVKKHVTQQH